jgi:cysteinyl-tRNA synthetase
MNVQMMKRVLIIARGFSSYRPIKVKGGHNKASILWDQEFQKQSQPLTWYSCGPTVYDVAHLGHARTYVSTDIIRRILINYFRIPLNFAMGVTDIDDKIINKGKQLGLAKREDFLALAHQYEKEFFEDLDRLNVLRPDITLKVSDHIEEIIKFIEKLLSKNHAYVSNNGVYFRISSLPSHKEYDQFGCVPTNLETDNNHSEEDSDGHLSTKENIRDFALWKLFPSTEPAGWESPWGYGRPGWHIECSTMTNHYFGDRLDIHSGGVDLKFPHHTNEIVQR